MARVTASQVLAIMKGSSADSTTIDVYIGIADIILNKVFEGDIEITSDTLDELERWLTAHLIAFNYDRSTSEEKLGDAQIKYTGSWGQGLSATSYGQTVLLLDLTGKIEKASKKKATIFAVPTKKDI